MVDSWACTSHALHMPSRWYWLSTCCFFRIYIYIYIILWSTCNLHYGKYFLNFLCNLFTPGVLSLWLLLACLSLSLGLLHLLEQWKSTSFCSKAPSLQQPQINDGKLRSGKSKVIRRSLKIVISPRWLQHYSMGKHVRVMKIKWLRRARQLSVASETLLPGAYLGF